MTSTNTSNPFQSIYEKLYSTETALLRIQNDLLMTMDKGKVTAPTLFNLSAVFNTVDDAILLGTLHKRFGISVFALNWLSSYLSDWIQQITLEETSRHQYSSLSDLVLSPVMFSLYTTQLSTIILGHSLNPSSSICQ